MDGEQRILSSESPVKKAEFGIGGILLGLVFIAIVLFALDYFKIISFSSLISKKTENLPISTIGTTKELTSKVAEDSGFVSGTEKLPVGYWTLSDDNSLLILIATISRLEVENDNIYAYITYKDTLSNSTSKKINIFQKNKGIMGIFFLTKQTTQNLYPVSKDYKTEPLTDREIIVSELNKYLNKPVVLLITLKSDERTKDFANCNTEWAKEISGKTDKTDCTPFVNDIHVQE